MNQMYVSLPASMHSCHFLADENEDETENADHVTQPMKSSTSIRHRNVANPQSQSNGGNSSSPLRHKKFNPKNGVKSPVIRTQQKEKQQEQQQEQQRPQPQPHQSESSSSSFLAKEMLLMPPPSKSQSRLQSTGHRNGASTASSISPAAAGSTPMAGPFQYTLLTYFF